MARFFMHLRSAAKPGRAEEYSEWCRTRHFPEMMSVPGVVGIKRFRDVDTTSDDGQVRFITLFELDCGNPHDIVAEFRRRIIAQEMDTSDSYDATSVTTQFSELEFEIGTIFGT